MRDTGRSSLGKHILDQATTTKLEQAPSLLRRWYDRETLKMLYRTDLTPNVERIFSDDMAKQFQHHCPFPNAAYADFKNKWLELPELGDSLIGIRFRNLELERPFVDVVVSEQLIRETMAADAVKAVLVQEYGVFGPKQVRLFVPSDRRLDLGRLPGAYWEKRYLAAPLDQMRSADQPEALERVQLRKPDDMTFYRAYRNLYEQRFREQPALREYARIETEEDLEDYLEEGTLFEVLVDKRWAGVIVVTRDEEQGLRGFLVVENLLDPQLGRQRLGVAVQYQLVRALVGEAGDVLFGTIDTRNIAAIKTAQRSGRSDVGGFLWLPL